MCENQLKINTVLSLIHKNSHKNVNFQDLRQSLHSLTRKCGEIKYNTYNLKMFTIQNIERTQKKKKTIVSKQHNSMIRKNNEGIFRVSSRESKMSQNVI